MHEMIQKDPGLFSEHFNLRCTEMFKHLQKKNGPLKGKLKHYWYRVEYQERGAPHIHALLWIDGAPVIGKNTPEEILSFINELITCRLPDKDKESLLHKIVTKYQIHRCSGKKVIANSYKYLDTCKRKFVIKNKHRTEMEYCRFGFPRPETDSPVLNDISKPYRGMPGIQGKLYNLQRTKDEQLINDYVPAFILAWGGNVDAQFIAHFSSFIVDYVCSYVGKIEAKSAGGI